MTKPSLEKDKSPVIPQKTNIIVQKFGGATLADSTKIKQAAKRIADLSKSGTKVVAAVSAMGQTTNQLLELANQVSGHPNRRELDMLLTTGERVSMALVSMALHDLDCDAISFTGSQAGILTNDAHVNASIIDVKAHRVLEALEQDKVVVLAGFQGVSPLTKEITTLGRGGTDTTAIAMAAFLNADHCEILKEVAAVFSADPKLVPKAKPIKYLSYEQMLDMTFWGAKVLHYRSVELAQIKQVKIYVGSAADRQSVGTTIPYPQKESAMFETAKILGLNSHSQVLELQVNGKTASQAFQNLHSFLSSKEISTPQVLLSESNAQGLLCIVAGPSEMITALARETKNLASPAVGPIVGPILVTLKNSDLSAVTATCTGVTTPELTQKILVALENKSIPVIRMQFSAMSITIYVSMEMRESAISTLHKILES